MKRNKILVTVILLLAVGGAVLIARRVDNRNWAVVNDPSKGTANLPAPAPSARANSQGSIVPAYQSAEQTRRLGTTLDPAPFFGKAREAYQVAKIIPATLAQLPCYCHCDKSFGHKSLHTCFEDDHAAHCAVCVDEALLAYQLQKKEKLSPEQVRGRIIEKYSDFGHSH